MLTNFYRTIGIDSPINRKEEAIKKIFSAIKSWKLPMGDYLEFGVFQGRAFVGAYRYSKKMKFTSMKFYAFDSFEGLPEVVGKDAEYNHFYAGQYSCSCEKFVKILKRNKVDMNRVTIMPGFFDKVLTADLKKKLKIERVSVVWIDCDLYESTVPVLNFITEYLSTGTFIVFDDWFSFGADPYAGEIKAVREWLEKNKNITLAHYKDYGGAGRIFLVQRW